MHIAPQVNRRDPGALWRPLHQSRLPLPDKAKSGLDLDIHVINLARRPDRLDQIAGQLDALGLGWNRVEAVDASDAEADDLHDAFGRGSRTYPATTGDIGCTLTHQRLWREIAASGRPAVVLEDDARLSENFARLMRCDFAGMMRRHDMGAVKLEFWPGPQKSRRFPAGELIGPVAGDIRLYRLRSSFLGTCGYVMTPAGAALMAERFAHLKVPVDHALFGREAAMGFRLLRPGFLNPAPVLHDAETFGSDIRTERLALRLDETPRTLFRRFRDWQVAARLRREIWAGRTERVEMRFAGGAGRAT